MYNSTLPTLPYIFTISLYPRKVVSEKVDLKSELLQDIQQVQNKLARMLNNASLINNKVLLKNLNMLSVNQWNAQIKITEVWKADWQPCLKVPVNLFSQWIKKWKLYSFFGVLNVWSWTIKVFGNWKYFTFVLSHWAVAVKVLLQ